MTFGMARDLYRKHKCSAYRSYTPPIGNHDIICGPNPWPEGGGGGRWVRPTSPFEVCAPFSKSKKQK